MSPRKFMQALCGLLAITYASASHRNSPVPPANAGIATCSDQSKCIRISISAVDASEAVCEELPCAQYKACLWWTAGGDCTKGADQPVRHTCKKHDGDCHGDEANFRVAGVWYDEDYYANDPQCQVGPAGSMLYFLLKDAGACNANNAPLVWTDYLSSGALTITGPQPQAVECRPRPAEINTCCGNPPTEECVWRVQLPPAQCGSPSRDSPNKGFSSLVSRAEVSAFPSPTPSPSSSLSPSPKECCPKIGSAECDTIEENATANGPFFTADLPNCPSPEVMEDLAPYGCRKLGSDCNAILCDYEVPVEVRQHLGAVDC